MLSGLPVAARPWLRVLAWFDPPAVPFLGAGFSGHPAVDRC